MFIAFVILPLKYLGKDFFHIIHKANTLNELIQGKTSMTSITLLMGFQNCSETYLAVYLPALRAHSWVANFLFTNKADDKRTFVYIKLLHYIKFIKCSDL
eukprot:GHVR01005103.1.p1 GENE.GHVR01005103.1~~GHVR01005103.1.p1  ORF type:complete len:100 (-),score=1.33 GHVR01005103.1:749-1048(-)